MKAEARMKVLHPTDFSTGADQARAEATRLARALGAELILVHVLVEMARYVDGLTQEQLQQTYGAQRRWAEENLEARVVETNAAGVPVRGLLRVGTPSEEIVRAAEDERADVIVMGTHGRGGLGRLFLGSVADRVIRSGPCPVVTVRERKGD